MINPSLEQILTNRIEATGAHARDLANVATEIVIFGSMAVGLERPDSDIDVLCVSGGNYKVRSSTIDFIVVGGEATKDSKWLQSELASHVGAYGVWIKGEPGWKERALVGGSCIRAKEIRVRAYAQALCRSWFELAESFQAKYAVKLRREMQRLTLLEQRRPVPPTRMLDTELSDDPNALESVCRGLSRFIPVGRTSFLDSISTQMVNRSESPQN